MKSKGYVKEQFAWRHYYWYLTNDGIDYLREYLHLPSEIVPATIKKKAMTTTRIGSDRPQHGGARRQHGDDRSDYRKDNAKGGPGSEYKPDFVSTIQFSIRYPVN